MSSHFRGRGRGYRGMGLGYPRSRGTSSMRPSSYISKAGVSERSKNSYPSRSMLPGSNSRSHMKQERYAHSYSSKNHYELSKSSTDSLLKSDGTSHRHGRYPQDKGTDYSAKRYPKEGRELYKRDELRGQPVRDRPYPERLPLRYEKYPKEEGEYIRSRTHDLGRSKYDSPSDKYSRGEPVRKRPPSYEQSYPPYKKPRPEGYDHMRAPRGRSFRYPMQKRDFRSVRPGPSRSRNSYSPTEMPRAVSLKKYGSEGGERRYSRDSAGSSSRKFVEDEERMFRKREPSYRHSQDGGEVVNYGGKERSPRRERERMKEDSHVETRDSRSNSKDSRRPNNSGHSRVIRGELPHDREYGRVPLNRRPHPRASMRDVQVTIKADGIRAVNSEGYVHSSNRRLPFVDLQCPHCPDHHLITFKEYKYHLDSQGHKKKLADLSFKHSHVLRNIRHQQRQELRDLEDKWKDADPDDFEPLTTGYCDLCKLAYKAPTSNTKSLGTSPVQHQETKMHKMQAHYLNPRCSLCSMEFSSRMIYEHHIASIRHLRSLAQRMSETSHEEASSQEKEELNLNEFITMDSVGEEEVGSEHDEITGRLEDVKAAEEDAKEDEGDVDGDEVEDKPPFEMELEDEDDPQEEGSPREAEEESKPIGMELIVPLEALYCKCCNVAIKVEDGAIENATERHCRSAHHHFNYQYLGEESEELSLDNFEGEELDPQFEGEEEENLPLSPGSRNGEREELEEEGGGARDSREP